MDLGTIIFALVAVGFFALVVIAIWRMATKKRDTDDDESEQEPLETTPGDEEQEAGEAGGGEGEDEDNERDGSPLEVSDAGHGQLFTTIPETPSTRQAAREKGKQPAQLFTTIPETPSTRQAAREKGKQPAGQRPAAPADTTARPAAVGEVPAEKPRPQSKPHDHAAEKERLSRGLAKTRGGFIARLGSLFRGKPELDAALLDQVEEVLFTADIGVSTSRELIEHLRAKLGKKELTQLSAIWDHIKRRSREILNAVPVQTMDFSGAKPYVILVVGVNGTGKTTTIGKLAARFKGEGHQVVLAAADTFRAAATEQLQVWGERAGCVVVTGKEGADPSSVVIDTLKRAQELGADIVLADTAGRLHTKLNLMEEIQKVRRAIGKRVVGAPHETILVLDSTMGQNAIAQAKMFKEAVDVTGLILTKLDGTAKGGVVLGICHELKMPVRFIGIGEKVEDLREFDPEAFVEALYEEATG